MKQPIDALKIATFAEISPGTLVRSTKAGWSHLFDRAIVIDGGDRFSGKAILPLDGQYSLQAIPRSDSTETFLVGLQRPYWVDGIDRLDMDAHSHTDGALVITSSGPLIRAKWRETERGIPHSCYVDMRTWCVVGFDNNMPYEAFGRWQLVTADKDGRNEMIVLELAPGGPI
jgi:hypothetical protein